MLKIHIQSNSKCTSIVVAQKVAWHGFVSSSSSTSSPNSNILKKSAHLNLKINTHFFHLPIFISSTNLKVVVIASLWKEWVIYLSQ
jgi:hypothetical protein